MNTDRLQQCKSQFKCINLYSHSELAITLLYHQQHAQGLDHLKLAADALQRHHDTSKGDAEHTAELIKDLRIRVSA
jgi:hypothetical protein